MTALLAWLITNPTILAIIGGVLTVFGIGWQQRRAGAKAERAKQADREKAARGVADSVDRNVDGLTPEQVRDQLKERAVK